MAARLEEFARALLHQIREDPPPRCDVAIGYIACCRVLGLSTFARIVHACAHRLHVQEYLVEEIVDEISQLPGSGDVAVVAPGKHVCMSIRGIQTPHLISHHCGRWTRIRLGSACSRCGSSRPRHSCAPSHSSLQGITRPLISGYICALRLLTPAHALRLGPDILGLLACTRCQPEEALAELRPNLARALPQAVN